MRVLFPISLFCFIFTFTACQTSEKKIQIIDLSGSWQFQKQGDSLWFPAQVPGTVQTDLFANNQMPDPYYSDNEAENKWIENENWVYRKHFNWSKSNNQHADLVFEGLDTYATVYLNGH